MSSRLLCVVTCDAQAENNNTTNRLFKAKDAKNGFPEFLTCINASQVFVSEGPFRMGSSGDLGGNSNGGGSVGRIGIESAKICDFKKRGNWFKKYMIYHCSVLEWNVEVLTFVISDKKGQCLDLYFEIIM